MARSSKGRAALLMHCFDGARRRTRLACRCRSGTSVDITRCYMRSSHIRTNVALESRALLCASGRKRDRRDVREDKPRPFRPAVMWSASFYRDYAMLRRSDALGPIVHINAGFFFACLGPIGYPGGGMRQPTDRSACAGGADFTICQPGRDADRDHAQPGRKTRRNV